MGVHAKAEMATCVWSVCLLGSTGVKALLVQSRMRVTLCDRRAIGWHRVEGGRGCGRRAQWSKGSGSRTGKQGGTTWHLGKVVSTSLSKASEIRKIPQVGCRALLV